MSDLISALTSALQAKPQDQGEQNPANPAAPTTEPVDDPMDDKKLNHEINDRLRVGRSVYSAFQVEWFRNVLYFVGEHHARYDKGRWRRKNIPRYWPRVITNKVAEKVNDFVSVLQRGRIPISYTPATDNTEDLATADVADRLRDVMYEEAGIEFTEPIQASWVAITGNAYRITYYDTSEEHGMSDPIPQLECPQCKQIYPPGTQECPTCHIPLQPAMDETGEPVTKQFPIGALDSEVCSPFEIRVDYTIPDDRYHRWYIRLRIYDKDVAKRKWTDYKDQIDEIEEPAAGSDEAQAIFYLSALARVNRAFGMTSNDGKLEGKVLAYELVTLPSDKYPKGLHVVRLGGKTIVQKGENEFEIAAGLRKGQKFLNIVRFGGEVVPGRYFRKTRINDVIPLQDYRNVVEAIGKLTIHRAGGPTWMNPIGSQVSQFTGEPLQVIDYMPITFGGQAMAKPEMISPELQSLVALRSTLDKIDDSIERVSGTFFLQGGDAPPNISAASALSLLDERAQRAVSPMIREWAKGWKMWEGQSLEIMRTNAVDMRYTSMVGRNQQWDVQKFSKADLQGSVTLKVDYEGAIPKSQATRRATIVQLTQLGYLSPMDAETSKNVVDEFGLSKLRGSTDRDWKEAAKEYRDFMDLNEQPMLIPLVQKSPIHLMQHEEDAKGDEFKKLMKTDQGKAQQWLDHIKATAADIQAQAALAMGSAGGIGPHGEPPAGGKPGQKGQGAAAPQAGAQAGAQGKNDHPLGQTPDVLAPHEMTAPEPGQ